MVGELFIIAAGILIVGGVLLISLGVYILFFTNELDTVFGDDDET